MRRKKRMAGRKGWREGKEGVRREKGGNYERPGE